MRKIIVKEVDKLTSKLHTGRVINEYLIYLSLDNKMIEAHTEFGEASKIARVNELILTHFVKDNEVINKEEIIEEISFDEVIKQKS